MNHRLTADEIVYILDDSDATAVFVGDGLPMAEQVRGAATRVKRWITLGPSAARGPRRSTICWRAAAATRRPRPPPSAARWCTPPGTTGKPKGALRRVVDAASLAAAPGRAHFSSSNSRA